jgi:proteic killer suppression protein
LLFFSWFSIDNRQSTIFNPKVIRTWKHKGLKELFETGQSRRVRPDLQTRALLILDALNVAIRPSDLNLPGLDFHRLKGYRPTRYSIHVNGPWCITFEFRDGESHGVNLDQYH